MKQCQPTYVWNYSGIYLRHCRSAFADSSSKTKVKVLVLIYDDILDTMAISISKLMCWQIFRRYKLPDSIVIVVNTQTTSSCLEFCRHF